MMRTNEDDAMTKTALKPAPPPTTELVRLSKAERRLFDTLLWVGLFSIGFILGFVARGGQ